MYKYLWHNVAIAGLILVGGFVTGYPGNGIGFAISWMIGVFVFIRFFNKNAPSAKSEPQTPEEDAKKRFLDATERLVALNQSARLDPRLTDGQVAEIEGVIDTGLTVVGAASEKFEKHPVSFEICRIVGHWLPDHVSRFAALSDANRQSGTGEFLSALRTMRQELEGFGRMIEQGLEIEYDANLTMIKLKYGE